MKNVTYLLLLVCGVTFAQTSFRHYNLNVERGMESARLELFDDYWGKQEFKSGGIALQRVLFKNGVTHRILFWGDPENWGVTAYNKAERDLYLVNAWKIQSQNMIDNAMGTVISRSEGSNDSTNTFGKVFEYIVHEPAKFKAAFDTWINDKQVKKLMGDRSGRLAQFDAGGSGATHGFFFYGKDMNDLIIKEREVKKLKATAEFFANRGKVEYGQIYFVETVSRY